MVRVRFAPAPTGSLHLGGALTAVANRRFADERGGVMALRIDDTDIARLEAGAEEAILRDLEWLGVGWEEGPYRQSERGEQYRAAAKRLLEAGTAYEEEGSVRFREERQPTLLRADGTPTYHLASVVDDIELRITHVIRGKDLLPATELHRALTSALGAEPPEYLHHGLILGSDGAKLAKRHGAASVGDLREQGVPAEAVRAYLEELDLPRSDVHLDAARIARLAVEALKGLSDEELTGRAGVPLRLAPALRGARTLAEARAWAQQIHDEPPPPELDERGRATLERFRELLEGAGGELDEDGARTLVRELKAVGGDLRTLRLVLTGASSGPELWAVLIALAEGEAMRRASSAHSGT
jgi:hypothetical protein